MPVELPPGDDEEAKVLLGRTGRAWQSDPSDEDVFFVRFRDNVAQVEITMRDASVQTSAWQSNSSDELESEISFRLSTSSFCMPTDTHSPLRQDYHRRIQYKAAGAPYNGTTQTWSILIGRRDLRPIMTMTPELIENADMLRRSILLRIVNELDHGSSFI